MIFLYLGGVDGNNNFENLNLTVWGQIFYWNGTFILETMVLTSSINRSPKNLRGMMFAKQIGEHWSCGVVMNGSKSACVWKARNYCLGIFMSYHCGSFSWRVQNILRRQILCASTALSGCVRRSLSSWGSVLWPLSFGFTPCSSFHWAEPNFDREAGKATMKRVSGSKLVEAEVSIIETIGLRGEQRGPVGRTAILTTAPFWHQDSQSNFASMWLETASSIFKQFQLR